MPITDPYEDAHKPAVNVRKSPKDYGDMTLENVVGEAMQCVIDQATAEFNTGTQDLQYARDSLKLLKWAETTIKEAIAGSGLDKRYKL